MPTHHQEELPKVVQEQSRQALKREGRDAPTPTLLVSLRRCSLRENSPNL